jgi:hypothetical protein
MSTDQIDQQNDISTMMIDQMYIADNMNEETDKYISENCISAMNIQPPETTIMLTNPSETIAMLSDTATSTLTIANTPTINAMPCNIDPADQLQRTFSIIPRSKPYNIASNLDSNFSVESFTPQNMLQAISTAHRHDFEKPRPSYLRQLSTKISKLPPQQFMKIADMDMHFDGGANVFAVTDKRLFCFYFEVKCDVYQVSGSKFSAKGWGGLFVRLNDTVHIIAPVFHCPNNPKNTFSPGALRIFSGFKSVMEDTHKAIYLIDHEDHKFTMPCQIYNSLDYIILWII